MLITKLSKVVNPKGENWDELLQLIFFAYNSEEVSFELMLQHEPTLPSDNPLAFIPQIYNDEDWDVVAPHQDHESWRITKEMIEEHQGQQAKSYDHNHQSDKLNC